MRKGFSIRMSDGSSPPSLVTPASLELVDQPVEHIDDLWAYTMPDPPFSLDEVLAELRRHILSQTSDIAWIANPEAASAFIGFSFDPVEDSESDETVNRIDLDRFNVTRIVRTAYESAFRPWPSRAISEEDVDELEQILTGSITQFGRRHPSPLEREEGALFRTLMAAYCRWQISEGCFLAGDVLDQNATHSIAALTGMPPAAIRNALSRDGISTVKSKLDYPALLEWVVTRRNFAPLREQEKPEAQWTWRVIRAFERLRLPEAFAEARRMMNVPLQSVAEYEQVIADARAEDRTPSEAALRDYAKELGLQPDSFILAMRDLWSTT